MNAKADIKRLKLAVSGDMSTAENLAAPDDPPVARTEVRDDGVFYIGTKVADGGKVIEMPPIWLCDRLDIFGRGMDEGREFYRVLRWHSRGSHQERIHAMNLGIVGDRQSWSVLRAGGLAMSPNRRAQEHLASWLQTGGEDLMHTISHRGGWNLGAYVLPSGELIGEPSGALFYNGDRSHAHAYQPRGSVEGWRDGVAQLCSGNSRPMLAIGAALAAPLLHLVGLESGGFHLYGPSGCGKTTSANVGASVWGHPREQILNWDATALALANAAAARNDGLMLLDEIGQGNPEAVSMAAYRLFNGTGKMQGARDGGNREMLRWRVLVLSTGEVDLTGIMQGGGRRTRAGQEVRLASLQADAGAGLGCFERLNGLADSNRLAKALDKATQGNREDEQIIGQAEGWFSAHSYSRFIDWHAAGGDNPLNVRDVAGYCQRRGDDVLFYVFPNTFKDEIAEGYDRTAAADVLARVGMLEKAGDGNATTVNRTPDHPVTRRFYKFVRSTRLE